MRGQLGGPGEEPDDEADAPADVDAREHDDQPEHGRQARAPRHEDGTEHDEDEVDRGDDEPEHRPGDRGPEHGTHDADDAGEDTEPHRGDHRRGHEVPEPVVRREPAGELPAPQAGGHELPSEPSQTRPRTVGHDELGCEPHRATGLAETPVQLPVLPALDALVEQADREQALAPEDAQVRGLGRTRLPTDVVGRATQSDAAAVGQGHRALERRPPLGVHDPADVVGPGLEQHADRDARVVGRQHRVRVDADHDGVHRRPDGDVQAGRRRADDVLDRTHTGIGGAHLRDQLVRAVDRRAEGEDDLERAGVVLLEQARDRGADLGDLVEHRHHVRDPGQGLSVCLHAVLGIGAGARGAPRRGTAPESSTEPIKRPERPPAPLPVPVYGTGRQVRRTGGAVPAGTAPPVRRVPRQPL
ncbi:hypothetical protein Cus16_1073 [Curtobacterium sp. ER1/6]|nr:hypothetical protein Cus16_1073 [Curtobacterium sp. ER1/6]